MRAAANITVRVPLTVRCRPGRKTIVSPDAGPGHAPIHTRADLALLKALARAFRWKRMLETGSLASISEIAVKEKIDRGYVGTILRLTLLAPDIVGDILDGRQSAGLGLAALLKPFPAEWNEQRQMLGACSEKTSAVGPSEAAKLVSTIVRRSGQANRPHERDPGVPGVACPAHGRQGRCP